MVRSVIPDSDEESGDEAASHDLSSTAPPDAAIAGAPNIPATIKHENASTPPISTQDDVMGQLLLGTGSTGMLSSIHTQLQCAE